VEDADEFSSGPRLLDRTGAATVYGIEEVPQRGDEQAGWDALAKAHTRPLIPERPLTPEEALATGKATPVSEDGEGGAWGRVWFADDAPWLR
jgi:hypothetical protein